jgi:Tfp pilus assembly protein FimT
LLFKPWENWVETQNPDWWRSYNNVKHARNNHFTEANLKNAINAVGALLLTVVYYYKFAFSNETGNEISFADTTRQLQPAASFLMINADYYYHRLIL